MLQYIRMYLSYMQLARWGPPTAHYHPFKTLDWHFAVLENGNELQRSPLKLNFIPQNHLFTLGETQNSSELWISFYVLKEEKFFFKEL